MLVEYACARAGTAVAFAPTMMTRTLLASLLLLALHGVASAQPGSAYPPPPPPPGYAPPPPGYGYAAPAPQVRHGFLIGFSLGGGTLSCDGCDDLSGVALDIHLGGMLAPNLALMFDGTGVAHSFEGGGTLIHVVDTVAAQYWVTPELWIKGGIGVGRLSLNDESGEEVLASETGAAMMGGVGYEVMHSRTFALDLQLRGSATKYDEATISMGSVTLGLNWY